MSERARQPMLERYTAGERTTHWTIALSFVLAALSGLAMFHPALFGLSSLFGGGPWTRALHPYIGLFMVIVFIGLAVRVRSDNRMQPADWQWLRRLRDVMNNREEGLPEVGRYNGGQKLIFFVSLACLIGLFLSGFVIWRQYFAAYFPVGLIRFASVLHAFCAFLLICAILAHVYAAIWIRGSTHAMLHGTVTPGFARKHHRAWFRQITHAAHPRARPD